MATDPDLIEQYTIIHKKKRYGVTGVRQFNAIHELIAAFDVDLALDYGCGQSDLAARLMNRVPGLIVDRYDPAIPELSIVPVNRRDAYKLVICNDVMEHIREQTVQATILDIYRLTKRLAYFTIALRKAIEILPNGENAHVTIRPGEWWEARLHEVFGSVKMLTHQKNHEATFICYKEE